MGLALNRSKPNRRACVGAGLMLCLLKMAGLHAQTTPASSASDVQVFTYPKAESSRDLRTSYPVALLNLCAQQTQYRVEFQPYSTQAQQSRALRMVAQGQGLDIIWAVSDETREQQLRPIRIPLDRGLIGWRLLLIRAQDAPLFDTINQAHQLAPLRAGQGHDWPDVDVLRANRFTVATSTSYEGLFNMLARGHIQYFPRSVSEIEPELLSHEDLGLKIEPHLLIHYPEALYFFVSQQNTRLADLLTECLQTATQNGSLKALFYSHYGEAIARNQLNLRTAIKLANPLLPKKIPLNAAALWFDPAESPP